MRTTMYPLILLLLIFAIPRAMLAEELPRGEIKSYCLNVNGESAGPAASAQSVRPWRVYLLPHPHVDIGYTHVQTEVERRHWQNIDAAVELCRKTADYPPGARYKYNVEVLWAVDSYLRQATPEKQQEFIDAVRGGQIGLDALYGSELSGLCRPEELLRLLQWSISIGHRCGVKVESAMLVDVPSCTWGLVPALVQAGVKHLSIGPHRGYRIGRIAISDFPHFSL
jgi:alpha-mannosidase